MQAILKKRSAKFTALYTGDSTAFKFYQKSIEFRIKGEWKNAGDNLVKCAEKYSLLRMFSEAACIYHEAGDCYGKIDKSEAITAYSFAVKLFCDQGRFDIAGRIERTIAEIQVSLTHYDDAALHYRKAANFLLSERDISDLCLERSAEALIHIGESSQSHVMYESIGISCAATNLRFFNADEKLMYALLCLIGTPVALNLELQEEAAGAGGISVRGGDDVSVRPSSPNPSNSQRPSTSSNLPDKANIQVMLDFQYKVKYEEIGMKIDDYDELTTTWRCSKEKLFTSNLYRKRLSESYDDFIDHVYHWNQVRPLSKVALMLLKVPVEELQGIEKAKEEARKAAEAKALVEEGKSKKLIPPT
ncbi:hypothetical protein EON65_03110 [archaeon]|nr:MAG: hypothetical protein EON65_03110 [archaeon]